MNGDVCLLMVCRCDTTAQPALYVGRSAKIIAAEKKSGDKKSAATNSMKSARSKWD